MNHLRNVRRMKTSNLGAELHKLGLEFQKFRKIAEGSGSPGEWMYERMDELRTEIKRRKEKRSTP